MPWIKDGSADILKQADEMSCGLCAVGMALRYFTNVPWQENELRRLSRTVQGTDHTEKYSRSVKDITGARPTVKVQMGEIDDVVGDGTYGNHLAAMLNHEHLQARFKFGTVADVKTAMRGLTRTHVVIVRVEWSNGGGHWVLVTGRDTHFGRQSTYTIHDPAGHLVHNSGSTTYPPGKFSGYWVEVTGVIASKLETKAKGVKVMF